MNKGTRLKFRRKATTTLWLSALGVAFLVLLVLLIVNLLQTPKLSIMGDSEVTVQVFDPYEDAGATARLQKKDLSELVNVDNTVNSSVVGDYVVTYTLQYRNKT